MEKKSNLLFIFALVYFFSPNGLGSLPDLPTTYLLKTVLKLTAAQASYFGAISILGWAIKPLWGFISDAFPLFGSRRKSYLILVSLLASVCWLVLALTQNYTIPLLLLFLTLSSFAYAFQDVVTDALMVELGKQEHALAEFQSIQWLAVKIAQIITGFAGGVAAAKLSAQATFGVTAFFPIIVAAVVLFLLKDGTPRVQFPELKQKFKAALANRDFLLVALFIFLWNFSPSYGLPLFYYLTDTLKFTPIFMGTLASIAAISGAVGTIAFKFISKRFSMRTLLTWSILIGGLASLSSLAYLLPALQTNLALARLVAVAEKIIFGGLGMVAFLSILTFAAEKTEALAAGTIFAFLMSVYNLSSMGSSVLGGFLFDKIGLLPLILLSTGTSLLILVFIPFLKTEENR